MPKGIGWLNMQMYTQCHNVHVNVNANEDQLCQTLSTGEVTVRSYWLLWPNCYK